MSWMTCWDALLWPFFSDYMVVLVSASNCFATAAVHVHSLPHEQMVHNADSSEILA